MDYAIQVITAFKEPLQELLLTVSQAHSAQLAASVSSVPSDQRTVHLASTTPPPENPVPLTALTAPQAPIAVGPTTRQSLAIALLGITAQLDPICLIKTHPHQALIQEWEHLRLLIVHQEHTTPTQHRLNV